MAHRPPKTSPQQRSYELPRDFARIDSITAQSEGGVYWSLDYVGVEEFFHIIRAHEESKKEFYGFPRICTTVYNLGQDVWELHLFPVPDRAYELCLIYTPHPRSWSV